MEDVYKQLPEKFLERLQKIYSSVEVEEILTSFGQNPLPSFRANTLKTTPSKLEKKLTGEGFVLKPVPWYSDAFVMQNKSMRDLTESDAYKEGLLYIQNLSSMIPTLVLDPKPNNKVLDIAAAPGSKTTQIAMLMKNTGEIFANDLSHARLYKLRDNLRRYEITNTKILNYRGEALWKRFPEYFDKVLVDVPCTMEGRFRLDDPKTYQDWSPRKIKQLSMRQKHMLRSAVSATKVGGVIVYSTCTLAPEENEEVIDWILEKEGDAIEIERITIPHLTLSAGLESFGTKAYDPQVEKTSRILPSKTMEGFFVAKIKKRKSTVPTFT